MSGRYGLLGEHVSHSFSPRVHRALGEEDYRLFGLPREEVEPFLRGGEWDGLNVTVPYKRLVFPLMDEVSESARATGSVNTVVRRKDGRLYGDNTDVDGFLALIRKRNFSLEGKILVLGSGGASAAVCEALGRLGKTPLVISRTGENNYSNLELHRDAEWIINTTPVGMYPGNGEKPVSLRLFPRLRGVIDLIYNPLRSALLLEAEELGIARADGLRMLVEQARRSSEVFRGARIPESACDSVLRELRFSSLNIVLVGMPGSGKSALASRLGAFTKREVLDTDRLIWKKSGKSPEEWIREFGEEAFRAEESRVLREAAKKTGVILCTGGGTVLKSENRAMLRENGWVVYVRRDPSLLASRHRPLLEKTSAGELLAKRDPLYRSVSDAIVENDRTIGGCASKILEKFRAAAGREIL